MTTDPRDTGTPGEKEWQQFRASFAAAVLHWRAVEDIDVLLPDYADDLHDRFMSGEDWNAILREDDPTDNWNVVPGPKGLDDTNE